MSVKRDSLVKRDESLPARVREALDAHGLTPDALRCELEMAHGAGSYQPRSIRWTVRFNLPLCKFCGRANPLDVCPAKVKQLLGEHD